MSTDPIKKSLADLTTIIHIATEYKSGKITAGVAMEQIIIILESD
jgi:hypothetical protein